MRRRRGDSALVVVVVVVVVWLPCCIWSPMPALMVNARLHMTFWSGVHGPGVGRCYARQLVIAPPHRNLHGGC